MTNHNSENITKINQELILIKTKFFNLVKQLLIFKAKLKQSEAVEYLEHGVMRRLYTINQCKDNIFSIFPAERIVLLNDLELRNLNINLHAFFINVYGIIDNLAWVFVLENELYNKGKKSLRKNQVSLFHKEVQKYLNDSLRKYLNESAVVKWYTEYHKNYRDALAHRIPLYVPPSIVNKEEALKYQDLQNEINNISALMLVDLSKDDYSNFEKHSAKKQELSEKQGKLGSICRTIHHSFNESKGIIFHAQIIIDFNTLEKMINNFCENFSEISN